MKNCGKEMYQWVKDLFPINRSITGDGVRETLKYIKNVLPELSIHQIPSGEKCFDWTVPQEWNVKEAYIEDSQGKKIVDFSKNNLHLVGYSIAVDQEMNFTELNEKLHYLEELPNAIPYITSYYSKNWGFCLTYDQYKTLSKNETYHVRIDASLEKGSLTYGEILIKGQSKKEIFLSTYVCHPSMANNELSGPVVAMALVNFIKAIKNRKYSYRIIFIPETIGSICYLSRNLDSMKENIIAGFNLTTIGDDRTYSFVPSRDDSSIADRAARHVLKYNDIEVLYYSFLQRASDERQYCFPGVDLPVVTICRSKYLEYPEYHTSLDNLDFISPAGLEGGFDKVKQTIELIEKNAKYKIMTLCEPQLGKRGLYPTISTKESHQQVESMMNFIAYADGTLDLIAIADIIKVDAKELYDIIDTLIGENLLEIVE